MLCSPAVAPLVNNALMIASLVPSAALGLFLLCRLGPAGPVRRHLPRTTEKLQSFLAMTAALAAGMTLWSLLIVSLQRLFCVLM